MKVDTLENRKKSMDTHMIPHQNLRELFEASITAKHIAESLVAFDKNQPAVDIRKFMKEKDFDVIGVSDNGLNYGYATNEQLTSGQLGDHTHPFEKEGTVHDITPLIEVFNRLRNETHVFVITLSRVGGIITRGDLQKLPVRMWLFGLISLLEMHFLQLIRAYHPNDSWKSLLTTARLKKAEPIFADRRKRNEAIDLAACLQFCDKRDIILSSPKLVSLLKVDSVDGYMKFLVELEKLRNELAHSQKVPSRDWGEIMSLTEWTESLLLSCEQVLLQQNYVSLSMITRPVSRSTSFPNN